MKLVGHLLYLLVKLPNWIFRQERVGKSGKPFTLYKVRTMIPNPNVQFATPEVYTRFGKFLRRSKIDELPQLLNVLKGDLNLVGPRSNVQEYWDVAPDHIKKKILSIKPGLTSLASIMFHDEELLLQGQEDKYKNYFTIIAPMKNSLDMFYIDNRDILLDLWILWRTAIILIKKLLNR